jgi:hypothetical protein
MTSQSAIFGPVFAMLLLTFVVWLYMYVRRISFIQRSGATPEQLAVPGALAAISPPEVSNPSDNLKNLFEIPVLFYALAMYLFVTNGFNLYLISTLAVWLIAARAFLHYIRLPEG